MTTTRVKLPVAENAPRYQKTHSKGHSRGAKATKLSSTVMERNKGKQAAIRAEYASSYPRGSGRKVDMRLVNLVQQMMMLSHQKMNRAA